MKKQIVSTFGVFTAAMGPAWADEGINLAGPDNWDWTGFYAGVNLGYIDGSTRANGFIVPADVAYCFPFDCGSDGGLSKDGGIFGAQVGYNFQDGMLVYGVEGDFSFTSLSDSGTGSAPAIAGPYVFNHKTKLESFGTARVRVGVTNGPTLFFATGGLAFGDVQDQAQAFGPFSPTYSWSKKPGLQFGWVLGGGIEHAIGKSITVKAEGLYYDLGKSDHVSSATASAATYTFASTFHTTGTIVRGGINLHF